MKKIISGLLRLVLVFALCAGLFPSVSATTEDAHTLVLSSESTADGYSHTALLDGTAVPQYDYTWHADPAADHAVVKDSPAEYYTGTKPTGADPVYIAHDIYYYPMLDQSKFRQVNYDGETEWIYMYEAPGYENYIFSTLPSLRTGFPSQMMHTAEEAYENAVLYITQPGTYVLEGTWHGQIRVDLGEDAFDDPTQKVTLVLNGVTVECTVAAGIVFASVYECDNAWEDAESYSHRVDTADAGANIVLADDTENTVSGTNIFRILKTKYKDDDATEEYPAQKKRLKVDGALYSYQSMNISGQTAGTGVLNVISGYEGMNSELHLTLNSGSVNIYSQDDGINVNEDGVSVLTVNGGNLHICAGLGAEGDGVDSNGFLVINGGTVISSANPGADSGLDSDCGSYINGGTVVSLGSTMDWAKADDTTDSTQPILNLQFADSQSAEEAIIVTDSNDTVVFAYDPEKDEVNRENNRTYSGAILSAPQLKIGESYRIYVGGDVTGTETAGVYDSTTVTEFTGASQQVWSGNQLGSFSGMGGQRPDRTDNMTPPEGMENMTPPEGFNGQRPEGMENMTPSEGMENMTPPEDMEHPGGFFGQQTVGATCGYETDFVLSQQISAFASVADYRHELESIDGHYRCSGCGTLFADAEGTQLLDESSSQSPTDEHTAEAPLLPTFALILSVVLNVLLTAAVVVLVILLCKKKAS